MGHRRGPPDAREWHFRAFGARAGLRPRADVPGVLGRLRVDAVRPVSGRFPRRLPRLLSRRTTHATAARACRGRCSTPSGPVLAPQSPPSSPCCAEARCAERAVPEGRRRKQGPLATLVAHSPFHLAALSPSSAACSALSHASFARPRPTDVQGARSVNISSSTWLGNTRHRSRWAFAPCD